MSTLRLLEHLSGYSVLATATLCHSHVVPLRPLPCPETSTGASAQVKSSRPSGSSQISSHLLALSRRDPWSLIKQHFHLRGTRSLVRERHLPQTLHYKGQRSETVAIIGKAQRSRTSFLVRRKRSENPSPGSLWSAYC